MEEERHRRHPALVTYAHCAEQVTHFRGQRVAAEIDVWNPSFDVTPAALIEGIITEVCALWWVTCRLLEAICLGLRFRVPI